MEQVVPIHWTDLVMGKDTKCIYKKVKVYNYKNKSAYVRTNVGNMRYEQLYIAAIEWQHVNEILIIKTSKDKQNPNVRHTKYVVNGIKKNIALTIPQDNSTTVTHDEHNDEWYDWESI